MKYRSSIDPFVSPFRRRKSIGLNVELENVSLSLKVKAALTQPDYSMEKRAFLSGDRIERLFGRQEEIQKH
jgi:hypothetical protein